MNIIEFLKKYSTINSKFIDDSFTLYDLNTKQSDIIINIVCKRLKWQGNIKKTLVRSYVKNIDYSINRIKKKPGDGSAANNKEINQRMR